MAEGRLDRARMMLVVAAAGTLAVGAGAAVAGGAFRGPTFHGTAFDPAPAPAIRLMGTDGRPASLDDFKGRPVFVFFGYTHCPDVCPLTLSRLLVSLAAAGEEGRDARVLFVSVDPARDTPAVLAEYARRLGPQVVGVTGDSAALAAAQAGYGAYVVPAAPGAHAHAMAHSSAVYGIDRKGRLRVLISETRSRSEIQEDVRTLVRL
jgi:protein SCO1/2